MVGAGGRRVNEDGIGGLRQERLCPTRCL